MKIPYFHIDAFTNKPFGGNYAGVVLLEKWLPDETLLNIAADVHNETAFVVPQGEKFAIRWFTPATEVDLCGHATLSTGYVLFHHRGYNKPEIHLTSGVGDLVIGRQGDRVVLNFPSRPPKKIQPPQELLDGLGVLPLWTGKARDYFALLENEKQVRSLAPNFAALAKLDSLGIIVTAPGVDCDFVSRFFAPRAGFDEDPVTGSAHCTLIPYWSEKLGKKNMFARQVSARGGELYCENAGERVKIGGQAVTLLQGELEI